ncbi:MAG: hypothetical protein WCR72_11080 [Bacteroidota bacterium]
MNTTEFKGTLEFHSPINSETSFTSTNLSKNTKSNMDITINQDGTGHVLWEIEELEMEEGIGLWFDQDELTDYDGVFELPKQLIAFLEENGFNMDWAKV